VRFSDGTVAGPRADFERCDWFNAAHEWQNLAPCPDDAVKLTAIVFERFDEDARRSLFFARFAASERQGISIELVDVLVGVMLTKPSAVVDFAAPGFASGSLTKGDTDEAIIARLQSDAALNPSLSVEMPFAKSVKQALQHAVGEADALKHSTIRPEHLILGILRDEDTIAWKTLHAAGVSLREMRRRLAE